MNYVLELDSVAEGAAGGDHRILELNASDADSEIGLGASGGCGRSAHFRGPPEFSPQCGGARASVRTRPTACVGALFPRSDASVAARSTGSTWPRSVSGLNWHS